MYYKTIFSALNETGTEYLVVGGLAVNLHGVPRVTQDLDLVLMPSETALRSVDEALRGLGLKPVIPGMTVNELADPETRRGFIEEKNLKAFAYQDPDQPFKVVDILLDHNLDIGQCLERKIVKYAGEVAIPLISIDDLIALKKYAGRDQDLSDIEMLEWVKKQGE